MMEATSWKRSIVGDFQLGEGLEGGRAGESGLERHLEAWKSSFKILLEGLYHIRNNIILKGINRNRIE